MTTKLKYEVILVKNGLKKTVEWYLNNRWWEPIISAKVFKDEPWNVGK